MKRTISSIIILIIGLAAVKGASLYYPAMQRVLASQANGWVMNLPMQSPYATLRAMPKSYKKKTTPVQWALPTEMRMLQSDGSPVIMDINGDGLPDLIASYTFNVSGSTEGNQIVLLNTGTGFEMAYGCSSQGEYTNGVKTATYYQGDCADYN